MNKRYHAVIVGSGMAGLAAAELLSMHGLHVLVVDDNTHTGGQLLRRPAHTAGKKRRFEIDRIKRQGIRLAERLTAGNLHFCNQTQVLGIYPERSLLLARPNQHLFECHADSLILATGAREKQLPFKGWTLPGVMATGAAQILMKSSGILPGKKTLIGGLGPLMLVLAAEILSNGGKVHALLDQSSFAEKIKAVTVGPEIGFKLLEGAFYFTRLAFARVPIMQGVRILEARGRKQLEAVVYARTDANGKIIDGTEQIRSTDTLAVGYGFSPNIELPQQAGCSVSYDADKGGWFVDVDASMATSAPGIYAVGETTGIAGAGKSFIEGQIAAWDILLKTGRVNRRRHKEYTRALKRQRRQQVRYGRLINRMCRIAPGCYEEIPDETIVCRCEEITMGEIRRRLGQGFATMNGIKRATRCTMGNCQGRICGPILSEIISGFTHRPPGEIGCTSARIPVKTVSLGALAKMPISSGNDHNDHFIAESRGVPGYE